MEYRGLMSIGSSQFLSLELRYDVIIRSIVFILILKLKNYMDKKVKDKKNKKKLNLSLFY
jgi:hypothetical protein